MCLLNKLQTLVLLAILATPIYAADSTLVAPGNWVSVTSKGGVLASGVTATIGPSGGVDEQVISIPGSCPANQTPQYSVSIYHIDEPGNTDISCNIRSLQTWYQLLTNVTPWQLKIWGYSQSSTLSGCRNQPYRAFYIVFCAPIVNANVPTNSTVN